MTLDNVYEGSCQSGHQHSPENTQIARQKDGMILRICRACKRERYNSPERKAAIHAKANRLAAERRAENKLGKVQVAPPSREVFAPPEVVEYWRGVAEGGREALVKEVSARLDAVAGPYAVGVMPDDVFWAHFRAAFADRPLPFGDG